MGCIPLLAMKILAVILFAIDRYFVVLFFDIAVFFRASPRHFSHPLEDPVILS